MKAQRNRTLKPFIKEALAALSIALKRDYFESFNRPSQWLRHPLAGLCLAAVTALLCGCFYNSQGFVVLGVVIAIIVLGCVWPWISFLAIRAELSFDRARAREGDATKVIATIANRWPWPVWGLELWGGFIVPGERSDDNQTAFSLASAAGWSRTRFSWNFIPAQRGEFPLGPTWLVTGFPFGLWRVRRKVDVVNALLVWPKTFDPGQLTEIPAAQQTDGHVYGQKTGTQGDLLGVRNFRRGDSLRRVHWAQTARHDRPIVCEQHALASPKVQIFVETDPSVHGGFGPHGSREWAIRIAASIFEQFFASGAQVEVLHRNSTSCRLGGARRLQQAVLDDLARLPEDCGASLETLLSNSANRQQQTVFQVVVTTLRGWERSADRIRSARNRRYILLDESSFERSNKEASVPSPHPGQPRRLPLGAFLVHGCTPIPAQVSTGWKDLAYAS